MLKSKSNVFISALAKPPPYIIPVRRRRGWKSSAPTPSTPTRFWLSPR